MTRTTIERLKRTQPPPGYDIARTVEARREVFRYSRNLVGPRGVGLIGAAFGEPCERREQAIHLAWNRHEEEHEPPGMWSRGGGRGDFASLGQFGVDGADISLVSSTRWTRAAARAAAWAYYWRRVAVSVALDGENGPAESWPERCAWPRPLAWSDEQVAAVERWIAEGGELPEVLRG